MPELQEYTAVLLRPHFTAEGEGKRFVIWSTEDGVSVKGEANPDEFCPGLPIRFFGAWGKPKPPFGKPFEFRQYVKQEPQNRHGVVQYLNRYATGIGPVYAAQLWDNFGSEAPRILRTDTDKVYEFLPHIPRAKVAQASEALQAMAKTEGVRIELATLFDGRGFPSKLTDIVIKRWGIDAPARIKRDPFTLLVHRLPGCGFARCNRLYMDLGLPPDRLKRQLACIWKALQDDGSGNTWHVFAIAEQAVKAGIDGVDIERLNWRRAVKLGIRAGWLRAWKNPKGEWFIAEAKKADAEGQLAAHLGRLLKAKPKYNWPDPESISIASKHQRATLSSVFAGSIGILAGTPGTGKTTVAAAAIATLIGTIPREFMAVAAPTGKAAVRIQSSLEKSGLTGVSVSTIHRLLGPMRNGHDGQGWGFHYNEANKLPYDLIVIDEGSMLGTTIARDLFSAIADGTLVLIVGDPYQLPPVEHGAVLRDMIAAGVPHGELSEVRRHDGDALKACRAIKDGDRAQSSGAICCTSGRNWKHCEFGTPAQVASYADQIIAQVRGVKAFGRPLDPIWDVQVIVALNDAGELNRKKISERLQGVLNPDGERVDGNPFRVSDKVICTSNCWLELADESGASVFADETDSDDIEDGEDSPPLLDFVANGEIGQVLSVSKKASVVKFASPPRCVKVKNGVKDQGDFELGYAITFHKSQGSQWPVVILLIDKAANRMASRELWYTGISRFETLVVTVGELAVLQRQCRRVALKDRKTFLRERLEAELSNVAG